MSLRSLVSSADRLRNRYRSVVSLVDLHQEYSESRVSRLGAWGHVARTAVAPRKTVLCYPRRPGPWNVVSKLCTVSGYWITTDPSDACDAVFRWDSRTVIPDEPFGHDEAAINRDCTDISKTHVSRVFTDVFGYDLLVDPTAYEGRIVQKSDENATHDGEVIDGPIAPEDLVGGMVYQKAIDNRVAGSERFYEYRVPVFGRDIPVVYVKYRPADAQFKEFDGVDVVSPGVVLSDDEVERLLAFTGALRLDYGELDVLRDRGDGRIYVVDANVTPSGPERGFRPDQSREALRRQAPAFEALLARSQRALAAAPRPPRPLLRRLSLRRRPAGAVGVDAHAREGLGA